MEKRYQVFVSSTYADLKDERSKIIQTLMEMACIPAGMELFPAADEEQFEFIKKVIDDCDYYILVIGGRYGSITSEGISYTEKEYDYAVEIGLKVIALIHGKPDELPVKKSEMDPSLRKKLETFREKVKTGRLVKFWEKTSDLPGLVALSLPKTITTYPAIGWVRANVIAGQELLSEVNELRKNNEELKKQIIENIPADFLPVEHVADLDEKFKMEGVYGHLYETKVWELNTTWLEIFNLISPYLFKKPNNKYVKNVLRKSLKKLTSNRNKHDFNLDDQCFQTVSLQLKTLGLVNTDYTKTADGDMDLFWSLTSKGENLMYSTRVVKTKKAKE